MSEAWQRSGGKISATLLPLLASPAFADSLAAPAKFREPQDYVLAVARAVCGDTPLINAPWLAATLADMGHSPLLRTTPDGYPTGESAWLSPAAMAKRVRLAMSVAAGKAPLAEGDGAPLRPKALVGQADAPRLARGTACTPDMAWLERAVGPLGATTRAAATGLAPRDRMALLLASPEFMRR
jgi:uncharacterized protein (DUF1800 family)